MSKVVLVSGSSVNLGKCIILKYVEKGFSCVITYLNHEKEALELRNEIINKYHIKALCVKCDITKDEDIDKLYNEVINEFGKIDVLINNAGVDIPSEFDSKNRRDYLKVLDTNLVSTFMMSKKFGNLMFENKSGCIINISSNNAINSYDEWSLEYDSSKAGLNNLTHNLANHYAPYVRVNSVAPGWILTNVTSSMNPNYIDEEKKKILLNRFANMEEIAELVYFISEKGTYINDSIIRIDGGKKC